MVDGLVGGATEVEVDELEHPLRSATSSSAMRLRVTTTGEALPQAAERRHRESGRP